MTPPEIPYYAVIFTSILRKDSADYANMAARMEELARVEPGFLGIHSVRDENGFGITVSYWRTLEDIARWRAQSEHRAAQARGAREWYASYEFRVCKVERQSAAGLSALPKA